MKRVLIITFVLFTNVALGQFTQTYLISSAQLANMALNCGTTGAYYNGSSAAVNVGFDFVDVIPTGSVINSVTVEISIGVECSPGNRTTRMNGVSQSTITTTVQECVCDPTGLNGIKTINVDPNSYIVGVTNQFRIALPSGTNGFGLMPSSALGNNYARVTVTYTKKATYVIPVSQLVNMPLNCGSSGAYYVDNGITGFDWTDGIAAGNSISSVTMELSIGIECVAATRTTTLNGASQPSFTTVRNCVCDPSAAVNGIKTLSLNPANYIRGGSNQFRINGTATSFGLMPSTTLGGSYARITVLYVPCATPATPTSISGTSTICSGTSNTYSVSAVGGATSYTWTLPSGWTGTSTTNTITTTANTNSGNITVRANNACGASSPSTQAITVNTAPATPTTISGTSTVCSGTSNTYSVTAVSGATSYSWTLPSGWTGTSSTNTITTTASTNSGNISVTANNACGVSTASTQAITVNTTPAQPGTMTGTNTPCVGAVITYSVPAVSGATSYTWTLPGGWSGTSTTTSINATVGSNNGNVTVNANNSCGAGTARAKAITVSTTPGTPGAISGNSTVCAGSNNTYNVAAVSGATTYTWTLPSGWSGSSTTNSISATAGTNSGNITVTAGNTCGTSAAQSQNITVNQSVTAAVNITTGSTTICPGETVVFTATAANEGSAPTYQWKLNGSNVGSNSTTYTSASLANGDVVTCELTSNAACVTNPTVTSNSITITVTTSITASVSITADDDSICAGSTITFSAAATGGGTSPSYQWKVNGSNTGTNSATFTSSSLNNGDVVTCVMTSASSCATGSPATSNSVTVTTSTQSTPNISQTANILTSSVTGTTYTWYLNGNLLTTTTVPTLNITQSGNYTVEVDNGMGCSATSSSFNAILGVNDIRALNSDLSIYPNPSKGIFTINATILKDAEVKIMVLNQLGQEVVNMTSSVTDNKLNQEINISELPSGSYFLVVAGSEGSTTHKLMLSE